MTSDLVEAVKAHAIDNYEKDGWDIVVECWADDKIEEIVGRCRTIDGAIRKMRKEVKPVASYRDEIRSTAW